MQIPLGNNTADRSRLDVYGNTLEGVFIELVDKEGRTYVSKQISETERLSLIDTLTRTDGQRCLIPYLKKHTGVKPL